MTDYGLQAQKAAELHLQACMDALDSEQGVMDGEIHSPASAAFCGCDTCCVRETLFAAWPFFQREARSERAWQWFLDDYAWMGSDPEVERGDLQRAIRAFSAWALAADDVLAEQEDQNEGGGDDRGHDVEP